MNEIEKLYENAGIEKEFEKPAECVKNPYITCDGCMLYDDKRGQCNNKKDYPPFTAKKQLELIKWCLDNYRGYIFDNIETEWFEEQLCAFINGFWQDLTEEERKQIRDILEG